MAKVHAVLLVPAEGDPLGLLEDGPCGATPPKAYRKQNTSRGWLNVTPHPDDWGSPIPDYCPAANEPRGSALVLAWGGKPVAWGLDRAWRIGKAAFPRWTLMHPHHWADSEPLVSLGEDFVYRRHALGTIILLDENRREIPDEEIEQS